MKHTRSTKYLEYNDCAGGDVTTPPAGGAGLSNGRPRVVDPRLNALYVWGHGLVIS